MEVYISEVGLDVVALCGVQVYLGDVLSQLVDVFKGHTALGSAWMGSILLLAGKSSLVKADEVLSCGHSLLPYGSSNIKTQKSG